MTFTERAFIEGIRSRLQGSSDGLIKGVGDDCAVFAAPGPSTGRVSLVTSDALIESVHFDLSWHPARLLGRKALSVNISDIAAMGGIPRYALLSIGIPQNNYSTVAHECMEGMYEVLESFHMDLIGGDTVQSDQFLLSITVLGEAQKDQVTYRSTAQKGDQVWVSGFLGQAAAGLELFRRGFPASEEVETLVRAHLDPSPQVQLGRLLAQSGLIHAMMDLSDGLATDLAHLCDESRVGAEILAELLPISPETRLVADQLDASALQWAISGGEDYQLLFTAPSESETKLRSLVAELPGVHITPVGRLAGQRGVVLIEDENQREVGYCGFDHFGSSRKKE